MINIESRLDFNFLFNKEETEITTEHLRMFKDGLSELNFQLTDEMIRDFFVYSAFLRKCNEVTNLTAITAPEDILVKHFLDSLTLLPELGLCETFVDVGTGAGFPGVALKIVLRDLKLTLLDSLNKRVVFLNELIKVLALDSVRCVHSRAEDFGRDLNFRDSFDVCASRAVAHLSVLSELCLPLVKNGGKFIAMKSAESLDEINAAKPMIKALGGEISDVKTVKLPIFDITHSLIIIRKLKETSPKYPRKPGKIPKTSI